MHPYVPYKEHVRGLVFFQLFTFQLVQYLPVHHLERTTTARARIAISLMTRRPAPAVSRGNPRPATSQIGTQHRALLQGKYKAPNVMTIAVQPPTQTGFLGEKMPKNAVKIPIPIIKISNHERTHVFNFLHATGACSSSSPSFSSFSILAFRSILSIKKLIKGLFATKGTILHYSSRISDYQSIQNYKDCHYLYI